MYLVVILKELCICINFASYCGSAMQMVELLITTASDSCVDGTQAFEFVFYSDLGENFIEDCEISGYRSTGCADKNV